MELIETVIVGAGGASSVTFSNLNTWAGTYKHLQVRMVNLHSADQNAVMQFNGDFEANYWWHQVQGNGSGASSFGTSNSWMQVGYGPNSASAPTASVIDILDAFSTNKRKVARTLTGSSSSTNNIKLMSGMWNNTNALTSITFREIAGTFQQGSRLSIYGIKGA